MNPCFTDREISWLQFNLRILMEAKDKSVPLLERLKFLSIFYSNLDEFFMVRVGSLTHRKVLLPNYKDPKTDWDTSTALKHILKEVSAQEKIAGKVYSGLIGELKSNGIEIVDFNRITKLDESIAKKVFAEISDLLSPRIIDSKHPMQFLGNTESYIANYLQKGDKKYMGIVSLYRIPKFRVYDNDGVKKVFIMPELISHFCNKLYNKKYVLKESCCIRVTRNADVFIEGEVGAYDKDFRNHMEKLLQKRKRQQPVRLQIQGKITKTFQSVIEKNIGIDSKRTFIGEIPFELGFGFDLSHNPEFFDEPRKPFRAINLKRGQIFNYLNKNDILLSYPYHSMDVFVDMLYEAADNKDVKSIKITLYRLSSSSKVAMALAYAADKGKDVLCLLELRARFDEKNNIDYSEMLTEAGCRVIYGLPDMKVHSKLCLITKQKGNKISYITQIGSGNYNEKTSELYCDLSLMTSNEDIAWDAKVVFDALEQGIAPKRTETLMVAPNGYKQRLLEMLDEEKEKGRNGSVAIKCNSINDLDIMNKFIELSKAGVKVELFVRGICCIVPGVPGETENITVRSIVGRYLEHSRIIVLGKGKDQKIFMGSGDLLNRNTNRRVEVYVPVFDECNKKTILKVMDAFRNDGEQAWEMDVSGKYTKVEGKLGTSSQEVLYKYFFKNRIDVEEKPKKIVVKPVVKKAKKEKTEEVKDKKPEMVEVIPEEVIAEDNN